MKNLLLTIVFILTLIKGISAQTNSNPTVTITAPTKYVVVYSNDSYTLTANASDVDGIEKVEFYAGTVLLGTDTEAPFSSTINVAKCPLPTWGFGDWGLTVKAYDKKGNTTNVSTPSNVMVSLRPSMDAGLRSSGMKGSDTRILTHWVTLNKNGFLVNITSATIGYQLDNEAEQFFQWTGNIVDGNLSELINFPPINNTNGLHTIKYRIVSRNGQANDEISANDTYSTTYLSNIVNKVTPTVTLVSPVSNAMNTIYSNQSYTFKVNAIAAQGVVRKVDFYLDNQLIYTDNTAPYEFTKSDLTVGEHTFMAKSTDDIGTVTSSTTAKLVVKPGLDVALAAITQPSAYSTTTNVTPVIAIKNTGNTLITSATVGYSLDGGNVQVINWTGSLAIGSTTNVTFPSYRNENGSHSLIAKVSNPNGSLDGDMTNNTVNLTLISVINNALPTIKMVTPISTSTSFLGSDFLFSAAAADKDGWITKVEFYLNGNLIGTDTEAPYELKRNDIAVGTHSVIAKAYDDRSGVTSSTATSLKVIPSLNISLFKIMKPTASVTTPSVAPVVGIKNLGNTTITSATITYILDGGEAQIFNWKGTLEANSKVDVTLPTFRNENGSHTFVVNVSSPNGAIDGDIADNSATINFNSVINNSLPTTKVTTPSNISTVFSGTDFTFAATATDRDGWITKVEFYLNGNLIGTDTEAPYELKRNNLSVGTHAVTVKAYDDRAGVTTSTATTLRVIPALNIALTSIVQPATSASTTTITPIVGIKNIGSTTITSATITYTLDGGVNQTFNWIGSMAQGITVNVTLPAYRNENGSHTLVATVATPNGEVDGDDTNNSMSRVYTSNIINSLPTVSMLTPATRTTIKSADAYTLSAKAADKDGTVTRVEFYLGTTFVGTATTSPYTLTLNRWQVGTFTVTAKAYDDRNGVVTSAATTLVVTQSTSNMAILRTDLKDNKAQLNKISEVTNVNDIDKSKVNIEENKAPINNSTVAQNSLSIAPNPAADYTNLNISLKEEGDYKLIVTNLSGRTVQFKNVQLIKGENNIEIDTLSLSNGTYIVTLNNNKLILNKKLIIVK